MQFYLLNWFRCSTWIFYETNVIWAYHRYTGSCSISIHRKIKNFLNPIKIGNEMLTISWLILSSPTLLFLNSMIKKERLLLTYTEGVSCYDVVGDIDSVWFLKPVLMVSINWPRKQMRYQFLKILAYSHYIYHIVCVRKFEYFTFDVWRTRTYLNFRAQIWSNTNLLLSTHFLRLVHW